MKRLFCLLCWLMGCTELNCSGRDFELGISPKRLELFAGQTGQARLSARCDDSFAWSCTPEPLAGFEVSGPTAQNCTGGITVSVTPASTTPAGTYQLTVRCSTTAPVAHQELSAYLDIEVKAASTTPGLEVTVSGMGKVTGTGIDCGAGTTGDCSEDFAAGTAVALGTMGIEPQRFSNWSGDADCSDGMVTIGAGRTRCTATFSIGGAAWRPLGAPLNVTPANMRAQVDGIALELGFDGRPTAAWRENDEIHVAHWSGTAWVPYGAKVNGGAARSGPSLSMDSGGSAVVAWEEDGAAEGSNVYVARWSGTAWSKLGGDGPLDTAPAQNATAPCVRLGYPAELVVAWSESTDTGGSRIVVKKLNGTAWVNAASTDGPPPVGTELAELPRLAFVGPLTTPTLAVGWMQNGTTVKVAERQGAWVVGASDPFSGLGTPGFDLTPGETGAMVVALPAFGSGQFQVKEVRSGLTSNVGPLRGAAQGANPLVPSVAFSHSSGGFPLLGWSYRANGVDRVYVERWSAGSWAAIAAPVTPSSRTGQNGAALQVAVADGSQQFMLLVVSSIANGGTDSSVMPLELR
ncbi:MAG: hypothetical protein IPJ65_10395 [Archangiaceae bacterium]|nr:hypothetical protein [Archangiaceae bacterium]